MSQFEQIPDNIRTPLAYIEINNHAGASGLADASQNVLLLGYAAADNTTAPLTPVRIYSTGQAEQLYGRNSMLAKMAGAFIAANKTSPLYCQAVTVPVDEVTPANAGSIRVVGTATADGVIHLLVDGVAVPVSVSVGDNPETIAFAISQALKDSGALVASTGTSLSGGSVAIGVRSLLPGAVGNDHDLRVNYYPGEAFPEGVSIKPNNISGGTGGPVMAEIIANMGGLWFSRIINPFTDAAGLNLLATELSDRWGPLRMCDGVAFMAYRGNIGTTAAFGQTRNEFLFSTIATGISPTPPWIWAAVNCAVATYYLALDPARPLQTLALPGVLPPDEADRWLQNERNGLLYDGISTFTVTDSGVVQIERQITMYQTDSYDTADDSYLDVNTIATLSYIRYATRVRIQQRFPRHKLADDGTRFAPGQPVVTPSVIRSELLALFTEFETAGLAEGFDDYKTALVVERDTKNRNRVNVYSDQDVVNQFRLYAQAINYVG
ncbi:phage tail sheath subtilisin-like domain-containing protein [Salmonella enterica subsp. enterica serovar Essen]|uniref:phage tail sheath subtilisin-like domain-containing protein n=1 Tax=Salmonella enterica TaxID=28901 RepID=UPI0009B02EBB|nr:phage tail sheath subtilisin-like domain-containing protein [Salmonella enterica]EBG8070658.1 phage tail protein [Salmonella enterica subsp. enterica serovar Elisabethville]EED8015237.1 phage tail protein [Salmonella enterica subsp. enterica]EAA8605615.1 phage tail protein [Salmonella enterica]EBH6160377.1 phage tail protein [Salmonella enterica]EBM4358035.1 phage tail protein [Salmonella enterica]